MLVLKHQNDVWALVEVYGGEGSFDPADVKTATKAVAEAGRRLEELQAG